MNAIVRRFSDPADQVAYFAWVSINETAQKPLPGRRSHDSALRILNRIEHHIIL